MSIAIERATKIGITFSCSLEPVLQDGNHAASIADNSRRAGRRERLRPNSFLL